ncbi:integrase [Roseateles microcysteis]|uniref:integrase n=1 Tax=Roseateles microcysteis TaxID=3119057 RepID=UPI002FE56840
MLTLLKNQTVFLDDVEYLVISTSHDSGVLLENKKTGERANFDAYKLVTKYLTGEFLTAAQRRAALKDGEHHLRKPARMDRLSVAAKKETHRRIDYLVRLEKMAAFAGSRKDLRKAISFVAAARGDGSIPHESTIYRWKRKYLRAQQDVRALFARFDERGGKGGSRLDPAVEALIDDAVDAIVMKQRRFSAQDILDYVTLAVQAANKTRSLDRQLSTPSKRTIQRRVLLLSEFDLTAASSSLREAERRFPMQGRSRTVSRILELVEIDHTPIDLIVTNEAGDAVVRPTATVVLDRRSRCVLGFHLSLAGHGVPAVFEALRHALLPKVYLKERYKDLELNWPCFGWMERVLMDNGAEFHADAVADALLNLGITPEFAGSRDPNDKPFVERFLRTLNYGFVHKLPGTTLDKVHKRVGFKAEDDALLTLGELDRLIHVWICNVYHLRPHRGLDGRAPLTVWLESAKGYPPQLKMNAMDVDIEFSEVAESRLQRYGIDLNTFVYSSQRLLTMGRLLPARSKVNVKWPRNDVGHIWVWDITTQDYFKVENKSREYAGLTLEQAKAARAAKSGGDPSYAQTMTEAGAIVRDQIAQASQSRKLAVRRKGSRLANQTSRPLRDSNTATAGRDVEEDANDLTASQLQDTDQDGLEVFEIDLPVDAQEA